MNIFRKTILPFILMILVCSCEKQDIPNEVAGEWRLSHTSGGFSGGGTDNLEGESEVIRISEYVVKEYQNGLLRQTRSFTSSIRTHSNGQEILHLAFGNGYDELLFVDGKLTKITVNCNDCFSYHYNKN